MLSRRRRRQLEGLATELRWRRWADDPAAFFREAIWVEAGQKLDRDGLGRARLDLFDYQLEALGLFRSERYVVVLKARQLGLTTVAMAYALWMLLFRPGSNIILVSKDQDTADSALSMLDFMWRFLPAEVRERAPVLENDAARHHSWRFPDGMVSRIRSYAATETPAAGQTASLVLWDEAALARSQADTFRTLMPTTDAGGSMIVFSTARGGHNRFAQLFRDAQGGRSAYVSLFFPWFLSRLMNPLADRVRSCPDGPCPACVDRSEWEGKRQAMRSEPWRFAAEYPEAPEEAFRMSGRSRFGGLPPVEEFEPFPLRGRLDRGSDGGPRLLLDADGPLRWRHELTGGVPDGASAVLSVDPATGSGGDFTAMSAGWLDPSGVPVRVAFWHENEWEPALVAEQAALLGEWLSDGGGRPALLAVEKQGGYGDTIIHELRASHRYMNMYVHSYTGHRKRRQETTFGFPMTGARRPLVVDALAKWLRFTDAGSDVMDGIDPLLRAELGSFVVRDDGRVAADVGTHDDLVMATAIWVYVLQERGRAAARAEPEAMSAPTGGRVSLSVSSIFAEAERMWDEQDKQYARQLSRAARGRGRR